jgi:hypothetical protein
MMPASDPPPTTRPERQATPPPAPAPLPPDRAAIAPPARTGSFAERARDGGESWQARQALPTLDAEPLTPPRITQPSAPRARGLTPLGTVSAPVLALADGAALAVAAFVDTLPQSTIDPTVALSAVRNLAAALTPTREAGTLAEGDPTISDADREILRRLAAVAGFALKRSAS